MCQLLGMNCAAPTDFNFSFSGFARRGGETDMHEHGWGIAIYEGRGVRTFLDVEPAARSQVAAFVASYPIKTLNMSAHIRYATQGKVALENVHPFQREMWGITWTFCHNGEVPEYSNRDFKDCPMLGKDPTREESFYHPVGNTDSEAVFCAVLNGLRAEYQHLPTLPNLYETLQRFCAQLVAFNTTNTNTNTNTTDTPHQENIHQPTILNFLLGAGQYTTFAYSWPGKRPNSKIWNGLFYTIRKPPFSTAQLKDIDLAYDFAKVTTPKDRVAIIATQPLTENEGWKEFGRGQLLMFDKGTAYSELHDCREIEREGRGLSSNTMSKETTDDGTGDPYEQDVPHQLRTMVDDHRRRHTHHSPPRLHRGADLGCGSGCSGLAFRACVERLTGVDLSPEMVDKARQRGCYDNLLVGDIASVLVDNNKAEEGPYDLVFACNVFSYLYDVRGVFRAVRRALVPSGGLFCFSAEVVGPAPPPAAAAAVKTDDEDETRRAHGREERLVLQSCARYAHDEHYLQALAAEFGFKICQVRSSELRQHNSRVVKGTLYMMTTTRGSYGS